MNRKIVKNTGAYTLVGMLPFVSGFFMLPVYSRCLTPNDYGILSLISAFTSMLTPVISLQLNSALPRYYFDYDGPDLKSFFSTTVYSVAAISGAWIVTLHILGDKLTGFIFPKANIPYCPYFMISLVTLFAAQLSAVAQRLLVVREQGGLVLTRSLLGTAVGIIFGLWFVVYLKMGALGSLLAGAIGAVMVAVLNLGLVREYLVLSWKKEYFLQSLYYSWPIIPHAVGGYLFMYSDRVVMEKFLPLAVIGIYSIADKFSTVLKLIVNSISDALGPDYMKLAKNDPDNVALIFEKIVTKWAVFISIIYLGMAFFSEEAIMLLTPERYHAAAGLVPVLLASYIFRGLYGFAVKPLFFLKKTSYLPAITFTAGLVNIILNIVYVPIIGVYGAAWSTVIAFALTFIIALYLSRRFFVVKFETYKLLQIFIPMSVSALTLVFIQGQNMFVKLLIKAVLFSGFAYYLWAMNFEDFRSDLGELFLIAKGRVSKKTLEADN